jgi:hypothetical protein
MLVFAVAGVICGWAGLTAGLALFFATAVVLWLVTTPADSRIGRATDFFTAANDDPMRDDRRRRDRA